MLSMDEFLALVDSRITLSKEVQWGPLDMWVRKCISKARIAKIEIALITSRDRGGGHLTKFLDEYEPRVRMFFENVANPRLAHYLERRGYTLVEERDIIMGFSSTHYLSPELERADTIPAQSTEETASHL